MAHEVMCRLCKKRFDTEKEEAVIIGQKAYYHKTCYDEWKRNKDDMNAKMSDDFWYEAMVDYLYRDVKVSLDFVKIKSQWNSFTRNNMTPKGIYFSIRYFYDVQKGNPEKALGGIGIVKNIYTESVQYWIQREDEKKGTLEAIIQQIKAREDRPVQQIIKKEKTNKKTKWSLEGV